MDFHTSNDYSKKCFAVKIFLSKTKITFFNVTASKYFRLTNDKSMRMKNKYKLFIYFIHEAQRDPFSLIKFLTSQMFEITLRLKI